ncbi:MAG: sulfatase-like hydrolase/transferase [Paraprevotella sp.]|nr:sulfatase-like hydrolase/transferase [Paraprevotella sp.]
MKPRINYLIKLFVSFLLFFILQKLIFTYVNEPLSGYDLCQVILHGLGLDTATTGYLIILPFLVVWLSIWFKGIRPKTILRPYFILIAVLLSLICIADSSLYSFWKFKLDATVFNYLDSPRQVVASVSAGYVVVRLLLVAVFSIFFSWGCIRLTPRSFTPIPLNRKIVFCNLAQILLGGLIFLGIRGGVGRSTMNIGNAYFSEDTYLNHAAINPAFNLMYSWSKSENFAAKYNYLDEKEREKVYKPLYPALTEDCERPLLNTLRPDVLIIIMEGFGGGYVEELGGAKDVYPNLSRLIKEGIFFDNIYANSFRTDRGLVSTLSGHISYPSTSIMKLPSKSRTLPRLARTLKASGYQTDFLYGGYIDFTNMRSFFNTTGYQHLTSDVDFSLKERTSSSWGAHDEYTFKRLYEMIKERPANELWHTGFLTLSSHEPVEVPYHRLKDKRANSFAYTDHCLGEFIDKLKNQPVWNNLVVICLPDHGCSPTFNVTSPTFYHIPMLWLGGAIKSPEVIHTLMNQSDMAATLLGQLGLPHMDFLYSRNIFSKDYVYPFVYSTYSDGFMFKDSTGVTIFDNAARKAVYNDPAPSPLREEKGKAILQTSYDRRVCHNSNFEIDNL